MMTLAKDAQSGMKPIHKIILEVAEKRSVEQENLLPLTLSALIVNHIIFKVQIADTAQSKSAQEENLSRRTVCANFVLTINIRIRTRPQNALDHLA